MKNKKLLIPVVFLVIIISFIVWFTLSLRPVAKKSTNNIVDDPNIVTFVIKPGTNKVEIVSSLKKAGLIRSNIATLVYVFFTANNLQAGTYIMNRSDSTIDIINQIEEGNTKEVPATVRITFVPGKRYVDYAKLISNNFDISYDEVINTTEDKEFLNELIDEYWFLTDDILDEDIYYPLEGYLSPNTYEFYQDANIKTIIKKLLNQTDKELSAIKKDIEKSGYSVHEILTMSSIIENEALTKDDREKVSQVIYYRLDNSVSLGMDVTSYYGSHIVLNASLTVEEKVNMLNDINPYNTRLANFKGLPVGPICNPSMESINASLNPSNTNYRFFIADLETGKVYFMEDYEDFLYYKNELGLGE